MDEPDSSYSFSFDQIIKSAFEIELSHLKVHKREYNVDYEEVEYYLKRRLEEINNRWINK